MRFGVVGSSPTLGVNDFQVGRQHLGSKLSRAPCPWSLAQSPQGVGWGTFELNNYSVVRIFCFRNYSTVSVNERFQSCKIVDVSVTFCWPFRYWQGHSWITFFLLLCVVASGLINNSNQQLTRNMLTEYGFGWRRTAAHIIKYCALKFNNWINEDLTSTLFCYTEHTQKD